MRPPHRPDRQRQVCRWLCTVAGVTVVAGCSTGLEVRQLATGRADTEAFELLGPDLDQLRREALRRCPQGADVVRQAVREQRQASTGDEGRIGRWLNRAAAWADPPQRDAQLILVCKPVAQATTLAPSAAAQPAAHSASDAALVMARAPEPVVEGPPPIGPIFPEW